MVGENGTWSGTQPLTFTHQWLRCDAALTGCAAIAGATASSYTVNAADIGLRLRLQVTATNVSGSASAQSPASGAVAAAPPAAPVGREAPELSGSARDGSTLILSRGDWDGARPIVFGFRWLRCNAAGAACRAITGATSGRYKLTSKDVGRRIRARVLASNAGGTAQADTLPTRVVRATRPLLRSRPKITGRAVLRARRGSWRGTTPMTFEFQWLRCPGERPCRAIRGATSPLYGPRGADVGNRLRVRVTATNVAGSRAAVSKSTPVIR